MTTPDPTAATEVATDADLFDRHDRAVADARPPVPAAVAARIAAAHGHPSTSPQWRALVAPAFDHPAAAVALASAPDLRDRARRHPDLAVAAMRALKAHAFHDPVCAVRLMAMADRDTDDQRVGWAAAVLHADDHAPSAEATAWIRLDSRSAREAVAANRPWAHLHAKSAASMYLAACACRDRRTADLAMVLLDAHARNDAHAAVIYARRSVRRPAVLARALEVLAGHAADGNAYAATALMGHAPAGDDHAWELLASAADTSAVAATVMLKHVGGDPARERRAWDAVAAHAAAGDVVAATALMRLAATDPDRRAFAWSLATPELVANRQFAVSLRHVADTPDRVRRLIDLHVDVGDEHGLVAACLLAADLDDPATTDRVRAAALAFTPMTGRLAATVGLRLSDDASADDVLDALAPWLDGQPGNVGVAATVAARHRPGRVDEIFDRVAALARAGDVLAADQLRHCATAAPHLRAAALDAVLAAPPSTNAAIAASQLDDGDRRDDVWAALAAVDHPYTASRMAAVVAHHHLGGDRRAAAWHANDRHADTSDYCAAALGSLARTVAERARAWDACRNHPDSANAASALPRLAATPDQRATAVDACLAHPDDAACATALVAFAPVPSLRTTAWDSAVRFAADNERSAAALSRIADTPGRRATARDAARRFASRNAHCATALAVMADTEDERVEAWHACLAHAHSGHDNAATALPGLAVTDDERDTAWDALARIAADGVPAAASALLPLIDDDADEDHARALLLAAVPNDADATAATALAAIARTDDHVADAWDACAAHATTSAAAAAALAGLARRNGRHADAWAAVAAWAPTDAHAAAALPRLAAHGHLGPDRESDAVRHCIRHAPHSPEAASALAPYAADDAMLRAVAVPSLRLHAPHSAAAASALASIAETDAEIDAAWDACVAHADRDPAAATALGTLASTPARARVAADAMRAWPDLADHADMVEGRVAAAMTGRTTAA